MRSYTERKRIEEAIAFLVTAMQTSGHNPKPVILHSIEVGLYLSRQGQPIEVVLAGLLHDVVEDSDATLADVQSRFGQAVAALVAANTFDGGMADRVAQYREMFRRCAAAGKEALLVKAADILHNAPYYVYGDNLAYGITKMGDFLEIASPYLRGETVLTDLVAALARLKDNASD